MKRAAAFTVLFLGYCASPLACGGGGAGATTSTTNGTGGDGGGSSSTTTSTTASGGSGGNGGEGGGLSSPGRAACVGAEWFISPSGSDTNAGTSESEPLKTFGQAFMKMAAGDVLVLLDGTYSEDAGTGSLTYQSALGGQIPSGESATKTTCVLAQHPGEVKIVGELFIGRSAQKDQFIYIEGITFDGSPSSLYNTDTIYIKDCGFHSATGTAGAVFNIGSNDGDWGNTNILLEDVWIWGSERAGLITYRSNDVVVRRAVVRVDGCPSHDSECGNNNGNSMVGTTIYNAHHVVYENVIVVDSLLGPGGYAGASDIQTAWHDNFFFPFGANAWRGVMSIHSELSGMYPEVDDIPKMAYQPLFDYRDVVIAGAADGVSAQTQGSAAQKDLIIDGLTVVGGGEGDAVRVGPEYSGTVTATNYLQNVLAMGPARYGVNSAIPPTFVDVFGSFTDGEYNQTSCSGTCLMVDPGLKYLTRIEAGSALKGKGAGGRDIGANLELRYGKDGAFYGAAGFDTVTTDSLWPWPDQARIKKEMCADSGETRGFCGKATLSTYVWEYLGSTCPAGKCQ